MIEAFPCAKTTAIVSAVTGVPFDAIRSTNRSRENVRARQITIYLARTVRHLSYPTIGRAFKRDHTTCMYAVKKVEALMAADPDFAALVETCRQQTEAAMSASERKVRERKIASTADLPLRITTSQVLDLAGVSTQTLRKRITQGTMPGAVDKGFELLFDRDAVLKALGLVNEPVQAEAVSW